MRAVENDFEGTRMTIPRARDATGQGGDGGSFVRVHRVQTRAITVKIDRPFIVLTETKPIKDACKYGVGRRGRARSRRVQVRRGQTRAFKVKKRASKACADACD